MALRTHSQKDLYAGFSFIILGVSFAYVATGYELGTAVAMGPGYFPFGLGTLLALLGAVVLAKAFRRDVEGEGIERVDLKAVASIVAAVVLFAALIVPLGLVVSIFILVSVASLGSHELDLKQAFLVSVALSILCVGTFIYALRVQMPVWPTVFAG